MVADHLAQLWATLTKKRQFWPGCHAAFKWLHHREHWIHTHLHTVYFGCVAFEAHGQYGKVAGVLFVMSVIGAIAGDPDLA